MRKAIGFLLGITMLTTMSGCAKTMSWQEQYDLGVRYLSEGNYEEAIIAFTAAIEIDPNNTPAYIGRGDAYFGQISSLTAAQGVDDNYNSATADYLKAIEIEPFAVEAYEKLGRVYIEQGDYDAAVDILELGYEATKDEKLLELLERLSMEINGPSEAAIESLERLRAKLLEEPVTVIGRIIYNPEEYRDTWYTYGEQYQDELAGIHCSIFGFGIRFEPAQMVISENGIEYIEEAGTGGLDDDTLKSLVGCMAEFTGHFHFTGETELSGPFSPGSAYGYIDDDTYYRYNPNGPWQFNIESYEIVE